MEFSFNLFNLFKKNKKLNNNFETNNQTFAQSDNNKKVDPIENEKAQRYRALEEEMYEKTRNYEVEANVKTSLRAVDCNLVDFELKANNIAGCIVNEKSVNKSSLADIFVNGSHVGIPDKSITNIFKLPKAAVYYYNNFYSKEKQLKNYEIAKATYEKYYKLMDELK